VNYIDSLKSLIEKYGVNPEVMELELTESAFFDDLDVIIDVASKLREIGFRMAIDDFGAGYSSLNLLKDIFVDVVKLDREFLKESVNTVRGKKIIKCIISMAKDLEIETVAEGVETREQVEFLRGIGCDVAQGYYFGKPMPMANFEALLGDASK